MVLFCDTYTHYTLPWNENLVYIYMQANDGSVEISPVKSMDAIGFEAVVPLTQNFHAVGSYKGISFP